jgi:hypothetical protein
MKICSKCNKEKNNDEFYTQNDRKNGASLCKSCFNQYCIQRWIQRKIDAIVYKGSECQDCKIQYPNEPYVIFDFHHSNPKEKEFNWNKLRLKSWKTIVKELDKCVLLCSNCHRKRHYNN